MLIFINKLFAFDDSGGVRKTKTQIFFPPTPQKMKFKTQKKKSPTSCKFENFDPEPQLNIKF